MPFGNERSHAGKTTIGIAIAEYIHTAQTRNGKQSAYPALLVGPGIVTGKENWPKEIPEVTPGAVSRLITVGAKPLAKAMKIGAWLKEIAGLTLDDEEFEGLDAKKSLALVVKLAGKQKKPLSEIQKNALKQSLDRANKNPPIRRRGADAPNLIDGRIGGFLWLEMNVPRDASSAEDIAREYSVAQFIADYTGGQLPEKSFAVMSFETAKLASGRAPAMNAAWRNMVVVDEETEESWIELRRVCLCPECGSVVAKLYDEVTGEPDMATAITTDEAEEFIGLRRRYCQSPVRYFDPRQGRYLAGKRVFDPDTGKHVYRQKGDDDQPYVCGAPLFEVSSLRRVAAAEYIKKKAKQVFGLCMIDECLPGDTPVWTPNRGWVPIHQIRPGDTVYASLDGKLVCNRVSRLLVRRRRGNLLTIHHSGGSLTCTSNHKIYTARGLVHANELRQGDTIYGYPNMPSLQRGISVKVPFRTKEVLFPQLPTRVNETARRTHLPNLRADVPDPALREYLLLQTLQLQGQRPESAEGGLPESEASVFGAYEDEQSNEESRNSGQSGREQTRACVRPSGRRKRDSHRTTEETSLCARFRLASGISNYDGGEILEVREARPRPSTAKACGRSRWPDSQASQTEGDRPQENGHLREFRVARVEVHQRTDIDESRGCHGDHQLVYNLEVENAHNYFANGILVGNCHKAKAKGTGVGWALTVLTNASRWTVGLTGTLFGGYSTSIFWLLYRLAAAVRQEFGFNDERRWTEKYGLLKRQYYIDGEPGEDGAFTGTKFFETVSEKPGISPAIAGVGLKYCTFSSLTDIGLPLPEYAEEIVRLDMTEAMKEQYADADGSQTDPASGLFKWALNTQKDEDGTGKGAIGVWLNTALHRPEAMFRSESVWFNRRLSGKGKWAVRRKEHVRSFESVTKGVFDEDTGVWTGDWLPKEHWLAETCLSEKARRRKTLVYVKQTGERDIQARLKACLEARGLRAGILKPSIAPEKRASWMKRNADAFDVLITNAKLVEVGLNLVMFSTAIFFEVEFSLYCVWQGAPRKLYGLKPVATQAIGYLKPIRK